MFEELTHVVVPILKGTDRMKFLNALDKSLPGMAARMFLDEALELQADWMQVKASMCCLACTAEIRCFQVCLHPFPLPPLPSSAAHSRQCASYPGAHGKTRCITSKPLVGGCKLPSN